MTAGAAFDPGKSIMKDSAVKILIDHFFYVRPQISIFLAEISVIYSFKFLIVVFNTLVIRSVLGFSSSVLFYAFV